MDVKEFNTKAELNEFLARNKDKVSVTETNGSPKYFVFIWYKEIKE